MINSEVSYHVLLGRPWLHKHHLIISTYNQCVKGRLNERLVRIPANHNPFSQGEVNFVETMFNNELEPDDESPTPRTLRAPILEEEEGGGTRDLGNLLDRMHCAGGSRTTGLYDGLRRNPRGTSQGSTNLAWGRVERDKLDVFAWTYDEMSASSTRKGAVSGIT